MNYHKIALVALLSTGVLFSCKKKSDTPEEETPIVTPTPAPSIAKIKSESSTNNGTTSKTDYTYDSSGRVTKMTNSDGSSSTLEWSTGKCIEKQFGSGSTTPASTTTYDLNASGQCTNQSDDAGSVILYEYNSDGYQTKMTNTTSGQTSIITYAITNGNQTGVSTSVNGSNLNATVDYFTDKTNTIGNINKGMTIFGKDSKNLAKKISTSFMGQSFSSDCTYEFDAKSRVTKMTQTSLGTSTSTSYTYFD